MEMMTIPMTLVTKNHLMSEKKTKILKLFVHLHELHEKLYSTRSVKKKRTLFFVLFSFSFEKLLKLCHVMHSETALQRDSVIAEILCSYHSLPFPKFISLFYLLDWGLQLKSDDLTCLICP